jgi:uncharacterized protein (DUF1684 family)
MYKDTVLQFRKKKDEMARGEHSPLPEEMRLSFTGLSYFEPDPDFIFKSSITPFEEERLVDVLTTEGTTIKLPAYGYFEFEYQGQKAQLLVIKAGDKYGALFRDATSGDETYGGGRSIEVVHLEEDRFKIDFNYAENQLCAYISGWSCPLPPPENTLPFPVRAGEKNPEGDWVTAT